MAQIEPVPTPGYYELSGHECDLVSVFHFLSWFQHTNTTTIICIHATWYKVYTAFVSTAALAAIVDSALETRTLNLVDTLLIWQNFIMGR